ncbi:MAG: M15 family metallopeptidase, partial [Bdellovibrionales bacterium]|nr:M15 family metallopeptidase [Bdellovibrionales bacterium]
ERSVKEKPIIDSRMTRDEALSGLDIPREILEKQRLLKVHYRGRDGEIHEGQIVVHEAIAERVLLVFQKMLTLHFPVGRVIPASAFGWNDAVLMREGVTSGLNYRPIKNSSTISSHGWGLAFDLSPDQNPCFYTNGEVDPPGAHYDPNRPGTLTADGEMVRFIESLGLVWGGRWQSPVDTGHIEDRKRWLKLVGRAE